LKLFSRLDTISCNVGVIAHFNYPASFYEAW
jgi:hypothetical protein